MKINDTLAIKDYFNDILSLGLFPTIILNTRIAKNSATLTDNLFTNYSADEYSSGILVTDLSHHYLNFYCMNISNNFQKHPREHLYYRKFNDSALIDLWEDLAKMDIMSCLNTDINSNGNSNYNILEDILMSVIDKHMPLKIYRFNKILYWMRYCSFFL